MSELKSDMAFEVGEMVYVRHALHNANRVPLQYIITERYVQECHGGIQRLYKLLGEQGMYPEIALTRERPAYQPRCEEYYDERAGEMWIDMVDRSISRHEAKKAAEDEGKEDNQ